MRGSQVADPTQTIDPPAGQNEAPLDSFEADVVKRQAAEQPAGDTADPQWSSWSNLWQVPAIVLSVALIALGVYTAVDRPEPPALSELLDTAEALLADNQLDGTAEHLEQTVKPRLHEAGKAERARFHAIVADWIALTQRTHGVNLDKNNRLIDEQYSKATDLDYLMSPLQLERWATALINRGAIEKARKRLADLEALMASQIRADDVRQRRNRVYRRIVQHALNQPDVPSEDLLQLLADFRGDRLLGIGDELWAVARQAELRLEMGDAQRAADRLLIEMRRLEPRVTEAHRAELGELYVLLARAYRNLGRNDYARHNLKLARAQFAGPEPMRGWALVLLARIAMDANEFEQAFDHFNEAVRAFDGAPCYPDALLGRAEVLAILGEHDDALTDFRTLRELVQQPTAEHGNVSIDRLVHSLVNRHDGAMALGRLDEALQYIDIAASLHAPQQVPPPVLLRQASTSRQLADNLLADAERDPVTGQPIDEHKVDPAVRYEAGRMYEQAAEYFLSHARATRTEKSDQQQWADSLWMAADSFDRAGLHDRSLELFKEYIGSRSELDPRRAEAMYRLAQTHEALMQYEPAAQRYQQVIDEHPRSPYATASFVPLARVLQTLDRRPEAEQLLTQVVRGHHVIEPDAVDYRDALIQLGALYYESGEYDKAVAHLDDALKRYPDDERINETRFRLADAHRRYAELLKQKLAAAPTLSPARRVELNEQRDHELARAEELFGDVIDGYAGVPREQLNQLQRDFKRRAHLYRADCAFLRGDYSRAVSLYDEAARAYADHHSSLIALIQIANCYYAMNDEQRARTAEQRARVRLQQLPDAAFNEEDALMDRAAWERWLEHNPPGQSMAVVDR